MLHLNCGLGNKADVSVVAYEYSDSLYKPHTLAGLTVSNITAGRWLTIATKYIF